MAEKQFGPLWKELLEVGREAEKEREGITNSLTEDQYYRIKESIDYIVPLGVPDPMLFNAQMDFDLMGPPRYRLYDAVGMAIGGRWGDDEDTLGWVEKLARTYIGCVKKEHVKTRKELYDCIADKILD
jgi:hypothetical protein